MDKKAKLQWVIEAEPGETAPPMSEVEAAKVRGYHIVMSDSAPEPTKDGLPVVWVKGAAQDPIPTIPQRPIFNLAKRKVAIPEQQGVRYLLNGVEVGAGVHTVPGEGYTHFTVAAEAKSGYVLPGKYEWLRTIGEAVPATPENLWVSEDPSLRAAGQELNPPVPGTSTGDESAKYGWFKPRWGEMMNNGFGGYGTAKFCQLGVGWTKLRHETTWTHASWKVSDHGTLMEQNQESMTIIFPQTRNLTIEFDFVPSKTRADIATAFWIGALQGTYMADVGFKNKGLTKDNLEETHTVPRDKRSGTWRIEIANDVYTVTSPDGVQRTQDHSWANGVAGKAVTGMLGIRLNFNECAGIRIYKRKGEGTDHA